MRDRSRPKACSPDGIAVAFGLLKTRMPRLGGGVDVDVLETGPGPADEAQVGSLVQQVRVHPDAAAQDDAGGIRMPRRPSSGWASGGVHTGHARLAESLGEDGVDGVEEEDLHGAVRRP